MNFFYTIFLSIFFINLQAQNYTVLYDAGQNGGCNCYRLTPDAGDKRGGVYQNNTINLNNSFDYTFSIFLGCKNGSGADGICFILTDNITGIGTLGGGLGYGGLLGNSLAIEFDSYYGNAGDPSYQHIAMESGGQTNHGVSGYFPVPGSGIMDDCNNHTARIVWDVNTQTYSVYYDGSLVISKNLPNMVNTYFGGNPIVNWGWSGATGGKQNEQRFCVISNSNWQAGTNYQSCSKVMPFKDISTSNVGSVQSWAWNFGEPASGAANTSTLQNPTHTYATNGTYTVTLTITDISGCANTFSHPVTINAPITLSNVNTTPACNGGNNGQIVLTSTGGFGVSTGYYPAPGYDYTWNDGAKGNTHVGLTAGTYTITSTDGVCSASTTVTLTQPTALSANTSHTDASCGTNNGSVTMVISGGTLPYNSVSWNGVAGLSRTGLPAAVYVADFKDANGCSALLTYKETILSLPCGITSSVTKTDVSCFGGSNGTATLIVTGTTGTANVTWSPSGKVGLAVTGLPSGTQTYSYTDGNGAHAFTGSVTINAPGAALVGSLSTVNTSCSYLNNGSALMSVTANGTPPYTYVWSGGQPNAPTANGLSPGAITVTVTDNKGCTVAATGSVVAQPPIVPNVTKIDDSCYLSKTGSATVNATGGNPGYTYVWNNAAIGGTAYDLGVGTYTVTVTDKNSCTVTATTTLNQPPQLTYTLTHNNVKCFGGNTGDATITPAGGNGGYTYSWSNAATINNPTGLVVNKYYVTASDAKKCKVIDSVTITEPTKFVIQEDSVNVKCKGLPTGSITLTASGGTTPYQVCNWGGGITGLTRTTLLAGLYSYSILDANNCPVTGDINITEPASAFSLSHVQTDVKCFGDATGSITLTQTGGTTPYAVPQWLDLAVGLTRTTLPAGTYIAIDSDANGCLDSLHILITQPGSAFSVSKASTNVLCKSGTTGTATLTLSGGTTPYGTVTWSDAGSGTSRTGLVAGQYGYTVSDANLCRDTGTILITEPTKFVIQEDSVNVKCKGLPTGSITLTASGGTTPYQVCNWGGGITGLTRTTLLAGLYSYSILDANNCPVTGDINITEPASAFSLSHVQTDVKCFGDATGSITLTQTGGTTPYAVPQWLDLAVGLTRTTLPAGTYIAIDSDANGCLDSLHILITQPGSAFSVSKASTNVLCKSGTTGTATLTLSGGTTPYGTVTWSDAGSGTSRTGLVAGQYGYTVSDANLCRDTGTILITEPTKFVIQEDSVNVKCKGLPTGSITLTASGGTTPYQVCNWGGGITGLTRTTLLAGLYSYSILDANNCPVTGDINITEPASAFSLSHVQTDVKCFGDATGSITLTQTGGTTPYAVPQWLDLAVGLTRTTLPAGTYIAIDSDANGCLDSLHILITQPGSGMVVGTSFTNATCSYKPDGTATATVTSGGTGPFTFTWSNTFTENNASTSTATALTPNNYTVTVLDQGGCTVSAATSVGSPSAVSSQITVTNVDCFGNTNAGISIVAGGGTGPTYNFAWSANTGAVGNNSSASSLGAATYNVTITDGNNCELDTFATVSQPATALSFQNPVTTKNISCYGGNDGSIQYVVSGGTSPYTYTWSGTAAGSLDIANNLIAGTYDVTITDKNGCSVTNSVTLSEPSAVSITSQSQTNVSCNLGTDGTATVNVTGGTPGYTYTWNPNAGSGNSVSSLNAGTYDVTVKDLNQCNVTTSFTITEPNALTATASQTNILCNGDNTGSITVNANGGTPASTGYIYNWNPNVSSSNAATNIGAGNYSINVSDSLACSTVVNVTVTEASALVPAIVSTVNEPCFGDSKGEVQLDASGGTPAYQYEISPDGTNFTPANNGNASALIAGNYTARVTDANGCPKTIPFSITEPSQISAIFTNDSAKCFGESNGSITATASSGTPSYTYNFSNGQNNTSGVLTSLQAGNYTVTVTDSKGCSQVLTTTVYQPDSLEIMVTPAAPTINLGQSVSLQATSNYGSVVYQWSPSNGLSCTNCDAPTSTTYQSITYTLEGTVNPNGKACTTKIKIPVTVIPNYNMYIPNAFTPNGDGINDYFEIFGNKDALKFVEVQIFNRWGEKVFESNDINFKWDGVYKGAQLNPGSFVYQIKAVFLDNHSEDVYKGSLLLLR